uniref:Putative phospholipase n=1 Tax=Superstitionia donensis TaxID=311983 RepID=A0A1V1WBM1_9SCOR
MTFVFLTAIIALLSLAYSHTTERELYVNFEPLPNQDDSWPAARAAIVSFRSEAGREFSECRMLNSVEELAREGINLPKHMIKRASAEEMDDFERRCSRSADRERFMIAPGTKWCGPGNKAANYSDLGSLEADKCCRTHDHCDNIPKGKSKYGLTNDGEYTLLNCNCDKAFDSCLQNAANKEANSVDKATTNAIKFAYFTVYAPKCYRLSCGGGRSDMEGRACANAVGTWKSSYLA